MRNKMEKGRGSVRLKFWQKTYLLTLALFLLALGGGTTAIASVSQQRAFEAECTRQAVGTQQHSVAQSLARGRRRSAGAQAGGAAASGAETPGS